MKMRTVGSALQSGPPPDELRHEDSRANQAGMSKSSLLGSRRTGRSE